MSALYRVKPLGDLTIFETPANKRKYGPFQSSLATTIRDLRSELRMISASDAVLELAVGPRDVRLDGELRADARKPSHPGCRLSFQTRDYGELSYTCDTYLNWQDNLRGIFLTLKALRAIDRYGATKGEQYAGFKALPAGSGATPLGGMTRTEAWNVLGVPLDATPAELADVSSHYRKARAAAHPDRNGGDRTLWDRVEQAAKVLGLA